MRRAILFVFYAYYLCLLPACAATGVPSALESLERSILYRPLAYPVGDWSPDGLVFEDAWFSASDGTRLHGWYVPCQCPDAVVLFAHGNAGNVSNLAGPLREFCARHRLAVMVFDYRGYGRSEGTPSEEGLLQDARAARKWLANRVGIDRRQIVLMGRSLGAAVMVDLAAKDGARALILESSFCSVPDVARHHLWYLPVRWIMVNRFDSLSQISKYHGPLLMSHGDADKIVPTGKASVYSRRQMNRNGLSRFVVVIRPFLSAVSLHPESLAGARVACRTWGNCRAGLVGPPNASGKCIGESAIVVHSACDFSCDAAARQKIAAKWQPDGRRNRDAKACSGLIATPRKAMLRW